MWNNSSYQWLLSIILLCLMNQVRSQNQGAPHDLKCITHNLKTWDCSWKAASSTEFGTTYEVCTENSFYPCNRTEKTRIKLPAPSSAEYEITISALRLSGNAITKFVMNERNVSLIPVTPRILSLIPEFSTSTLYLKWNDNGSAFPHSSRASWEIKVMHKENMEVIKLATFRTNLIGKDSILAWHWTSDMPLECTSHSVSIRYYIDVVHFSGHKEWSEWSPPKTVFGYQAKLKNKVFPQDKVILVGSNITICCVIQDGDTFNEFLLGNQHYNPIHLDHQNVAIQIDKINASQSSGTNAVFFTEKDIVGTVIFVGYPPDTPQELNCETHNLKEILCSWKAGRSTKLFGPYGTNYTLYERISGRSITHKSPDSLDENYLLPFQMLTNQKLYNFTLQANNPLGRSETSVLVDITQRVVPRAPTKLYVQDDDSTNVILHWNMPGNFAKMKLFCQIEVNTTDSEPKVLNISMEGLDTSGYQVYLNMLNPYTRYTFRVRCSSENFWRWSEWSNKKQYSTKEALPSKGPDIWREWSSDGKKLIIYWKPLPINEAKGKILSYGLSYSSSKETHYIPEIPDSQHKAEIRLDRNDYTISVVARNSAGLSPPSNISSVELPNDDLKMEKVVGTGKGILLSWNYNPNVTCDYVVKWCNSTQSDPCLVEWKKFPSNSSGALLESDHFQPGVKYNFSIYGCRDQRYQLFSSTIGYVKELAPSVAPNFTVEDTTADSVLVKWEDIPSDDLRGFLRGYLFYFDKGEKGTSKTRDLEPGASELKVKNITDITQKTLRIADLQGRTSYHLVLRAYTNGGVGPEKDMYVVTKENSIGLIIAILIPVGVAIIVGVVTSVLCYRKREWIKETFYPDIPNPENSKALQFQKSICEGSTALKTLKMNPCTPNNLEVVETQSTVPKIEDPEMTSPGIVRSEEGSDAEPENLVVVSYCPPIIEEEISNLPGDEAGGSSQVIYIDVQSMYQPQAKPEEELANDSVDGAGYKPQMHLPINSALADITAEEDLDKMVGYRPQVNVNTWNLGSPDSPSSIDSNSEMVSFGSPCSINSRQFLIPPKDEESPKPSSGGWSFTNFFHNKPND
ncbi:leukemia inhibitory factor receptor [Tachyglossus aculeatus]|uniref:leukemia inhibitory factor receptor n=1 Tax=Tachyglossus aculeatus TaxID=9261 RepID=UPI0018F65919|nr:leukemia inhibitory factor receptor [Tachyglossus aculeatus]XP_038600341.1 leukemia inhibitory factor receptor [Tachyglossus aculeatus]